MFFHNSCLFSRRALRIRFDKKIQQLWAFFVYENGVDEINLFQINLFQIKLFQINLFQIYLFQIKLLHLRKIYDDERNG